MQAMKVFIIKKSGRVLILRRIYRPCCYFDNQ
jgi:hypothetical protein